MAASHGKAPRRRGRHQQRAPLDVHFLRIDEVDRPVLQQRVGERAVHEEDGRRPVRGVMQLLPAMAAEQAAEVRGEHDERDEIERDRAKRVLERLRRRPDRHRDVEQPEACGRRPKQDQRVQQRRGKTDVAEPVVNGEQLQPASARPAADRVVADRQQQSEQNLRREEAERRQSDDRRDIDGGGHRESLPPSSVRLMAHRSGDSRTLLEEFAGLFGRP